jgi:hypothetical protein
MRSSAAAARRTRSPSILPCCRQYSRAKRCPRGSERRGIATTKLRGNDQVLLNYLGLDAKTRHTTLTFDPPPDRLATGVANYDLHLAPGEMRPIFLTAGCDQTKTRPLPFLRGFITDDLGNTVWRVTRADDEELDQLTA